MNNDIFGALFALRFQYTKTQCKEGARYVNVYLETPIVLHVYHFLSRKRDFNGDQFVLKWSDCPCFENDEEEVISYSIQPQFDDAYNLLSLTQASHVHVEPFISTIYSYNK